MHPSEDFTEVIGGKRYSVKNSKLLSGNDYWDGHNYERRGRNTFLYRTPKGNYFSVTLTQWEGEQTTLEPMDPNSALTLYEQLSEKRVSVEEAFPNITIEEA
jgi:hypothetical protein